MKIIYHERVWKTISLISEEDRSVVLKVVDLLEDYGFQLSTKYLKKLNKRIWELRAKQYRLLFGVIREFAVAVNFFSKKTQKTPIKEIKLSIYRLKQYDQ
jgi:phage-related protein